MRPSTQLLSLTFCIFLSALRAAPVFQTVEIVTDTLPSFSTEALDPKFIVAVDTHGTAEEDAAVGRSMLMRDSSGRQFVCRLPDNVTGTTDSDGLVRGSGVAGATQKSPSELLAPLDTLCLYRIEDWWTYELCYAKSVRQFHKEGDKVVSEYNLGTYSPERSALDDVREDDSPGAASPAAYVMQMYDGGQPCDITGEPRSTEVRYVCAEGGKDSVSAIVEAATCRYVLTFSTPRLCSHPAFQTPEPPVHHILCTLAEGEPEEYVAAEEEEDADGSAAASGEGNAGEGDSSSAAGKEGGLHEITAQETAKVIGGSMGAGVRELTRVLEAASQGLEVNLSTLQAALANAELEEGDDSGDDSEDGILGVDEAPEERHADFAEEDEPSGGSGVGPPAAQEERAAVAGGEVADDDAESDKVEEEDFSRTGMHAKL